MLPRQRRQILLAEIATVLDVGANAGQYARWLRREVGFAGRIISFEPVREVYDHLALAAADDDAWDCHRTALGERSGQLEITVTQESEFSSALVPAPHVVGHWPGAAARATELVPVTTLAEIWPDLGCVGRVFLKVDVEGYELAVLRGAGAVLSGVSLIELEISVAPNFRGGPGLAEVLHALDEAGFDLVALEQNHGDLEDGQMLMVDGVFRNRREL
ncbi:FkbM family methyltransferase [Actinokineospora inagensis]|uniref:FkbM family methyltransferase n=1 Tax=Actinokineospora inagensis TaxID=103730 RepID=UPI00047B410D|nr:FkbM family methyltransferase [Actinokineospora inagensis]